MKTILEKFERITKDNPYYSSYVCFCRTIDGKFLMPKELKKWFNKLVEKDDYCRSEKEAITEYLCKTFGWKPRNLR